MRHLQLIAIAMSFGIGCGSNPSDESGSGSGSGSESGSTSGSESTDGTSSSQQGSGQQGGDEFQLNHSTDADQAHGEHPSEIEATRALAAMRLFLVNPDAGPIEDIVIKLTAPDGVSYYTHPTDSLGYGEVLVPAGQRYVVEYLMLGRRSVTANVTVPAGPNQDIRLTMRHRPRPGRVIPLVPGQPDPPPEPEGLVLEGILFDTGRAAIQEESFPRLDRVVEYMTHMTGVRIRVSGHTDNVGNARRNQALSESRAQAVRQYLVDHAIDGGRVEAVGYGHQRPVSSNDTEEGRARNRRIEAVEL